MNRSATARPFGIRDKVGYLFGDFGNDFTFIFSTMMLMKFYTSINIPYGSMASAISAEPDDRQSLSTFRTMGGTLAGVVIGVGLPLIAYQKVDGVETLIGPRVTLAAGVFSVLAVVCYLLCYTMVTERVQVPATDKKQDSVFQMLKSAVHNRALISIIAASIVMLLAQLTMQGMSGYVYPDYYNNAGAQSASTLTMMVGMLLAAALVKPLAKRFGKCEVSVASSIFVVIVNVVLMVVRPENVWVYVAFQFLCWLGLGMFSMVTWALITDVIDYSELKNGKREDGTVYALYSFARKLGQAASAGLTGLLLEVIGYSAATRTDPTVQAGLFNISVLVPALGFALLAAILWFWYPLHKKQVDENVVALKAKHENEKN